MGKTIIYLGIGISVLILVAVFIGLSLIQPISKDIKVFQNEITNPTPVITAPDEADSGAVNAPRQEIKLIQLPIPEENSGIFNKVNSFAEEEVVQSSGFGTGVINTFSVETKELDPFVTIKQKSISNNGTHIYAVVVIEPTNNTPELFESSINFTKIRGNELTRVDYNSDPKGFASGKDKDGLFFSKKSELNGEYGILIPYDQALEYEIKAGNGSAISTLANTTMISINNQGKYSIKLDVTNSNCFMGRYATSSSSLKMGNGTVVHSGDEAQSYSPIAITNKANGVFGLRTSVGCSLGGQTWSYGVAYNNSFMTVLDFTTDGGNMSINWSFVDEYPFTFAHYKWNQPMFTSLQGGAGLVMGSGTTGYIANTSAYFFNESGIVFLDGLPNGYVCFKYAEQFVNSQNWCYWSNITELRKSGGGSFGPSKDGSFSWPSLENDLAVGFTEQAVGPSNAVEIYNLTETNDVSTSCDAGSLIRLNNQIYYVALNGSGDFGCWFNNSIDLKDVGIDDIKYIIMRNTSSYSAKTYSMTTSSEVRSVAWLNFTEAVKSSNTSLADLANQTLGFYAVKFNQSGNQTSFFSSYDVPSFTLPPSFPVLTIASPVNGSTQNTLDDSSKNPRPAGYWLNTTSNEQLSWLDINLNYLDVPNPSLNITVNTANKTVINSPTNTSFNYWITDQPNSRVSARFIANDTTNNISNSNVSNYTVNVTSQMVITITSPKNISYGGLPNATWELIIGNGSTTATCIYQVTGVNYTYSNTCSLNVNDNIISNASVDGLQNWITVWYNDTLGVVSVSENISYFLDTATGAVISIIHPENITYFNHTNYVEIVCTGGECTSGAYNYSLNGRRNISVDGFSPSKFPINTTGGFNTLLVSMSGTNVSTTFQAIVNFTVDPMCNATYVGVNKICTGPTLQHISTCTKVGKETYEYVKYGMTYCSGGCQNAECIEIDTCRSRCSLGSAVCQGSDLIFCGDDNNDGCNEFSQVNITSCQFGCSNGACLSRLNECSFGETRCSGMGLQACDDDNNDGFFEWSKVNITFCDYGCKTTLNETTNLTDSYCNYHSFGDVYFTRGIFTRLSTDLDIMFGDPDPGLDQGKKTIFFSIFAGIFSLGIGTMIKRWTIAIILFAIMITAGIFIGWVVFYIGIPLILVMALGKIIKGGSDEE